MHLQRLAQIIIPEDDLNVPMQNNGTVDGNNIDEILKIVFGLGGGIAMIVIVIAGIMFILSRGDPQKASTARAAIIYAGVGLAVMVLAFSIVSFVVESV